MNRKKVVWRLFFFGLFLSALFFIIHIFYPDSFPFSKKRIYDLSHSSKNITLSDEDVTFSVSTEASTVEGFLQEKGLSLGEADNIFPELNTPVYPGLNIAIQRSIPFVIKVDGKTLKNRSTSKTVLGALEENNITLGRLDIASEPLYSRFGNNDTITITRINVEEKTVAADIDFKTISKTDSKLGWREKKVQQAGVKGIREIKYKITYRNDKEVSRIILESNIVKDPVDAIITQGTYMQLGKSNAGQGTWYSFQNGLFAASTSIPKGSFAKVTNTANGKSVIVEINDYGPFGKGRVIDLDKVAFTKISSVGAGVIGVKVEQVLN